MQVVAGVLGRDGNFLLTLRTAGRAYADHWEIPGGKVEPGETKFEALHREWLEEVGVAVKAAQVVASVRSGGCGEIEVTVFLVTDHEGEATPCESQSLAWLSRSQITDGRPLTPATRAFFQNF